MRLTCFSMRHKRRAPLCFVSIAALAWAVSPIAHAEEKIPAIVAKLSEAKAKAEGRASLVQGCIVKGNPKVLPAFVTKFDDARNPHNAWIDGLIVALKIHQERTLEESVEVGRLNAAQNKIDEFVSMADKALDKHGCATAYKKAAWGPVVTALLPVVIKELFDYFRGLPDREEKREEAIRLFESKKIVDWQNVRAFVVFDWNLERFYAPYELTSSTLKKGSASVYLNKWGLTAEPPGQVLPDKERPWGLSESYKAYGGPLGDLPNYAY